MIPIIYESTERSFTSNGLGRLQDCISGTAVEERNGVYEINFEYPTNGRNFDKIQLGRVVAVTHDESGKVQPFDIVSCTKPLNGIVKFHGVHISYRLMKQVLSARLSGNIAGVMAYLTAQGYGFIFSTDIESEGNAFEVKAGYPVPVRQYLGGMEGSVLDNYGGEYEFDKFSVILHKARGKKKDFSIRYGLNLSEYEEDLDYSDSFNKCVPFWLGADETLVVGDTVDSGAASYNGLDLIVPLDLTQKFSNKPTKANLESAALSYMVANKPYMPEQNIKVDFVRIQDSPEYEQFKSLLRCNLCDSINVIFPRYGTDAYFKIVKTEWDFLKDQYVSMELGDLQTSLADALGVGSESTNPRTELIKERHQVLYSSSDDGAHVSIAPGATSEQTFLVTKDGYMAFGLVGHAFAGSNRGQMSLGCKGRVNATEVGSCTVDVLMRNNGTSGTWSGGLYVDILWMKI